MLKNLSMPQTSDRKLGERSYRVTVSPVVDAQGKRIGIVAEWMDRTVEVAVEDEVQTIVRASMRGDLSQGVRPLEPVRVSARTSWTSTSATSTSARSAVAAPPSRSARTTR